MVPLTLRKYLETHFLGGRFPSELFAGYPLVLNIASEHGPFIVDLPIKNGDFP